MTHWRKNTERTINHCACHCTLIYIISHNFCSFSLIGLSRGVREQIPSPLFLGGRPVICSLSGVPSTRPFSCHQRLLSPQNMARLDTTTHCVWKRRCSQQSIATLIFIIYHCTLLFFSSFFGCWLVGVFLLFPDWLCYRGQWRWCKSKLLWWPDSCQKPSSPPGSNLKISISNWQMDGLMVYKMTHPSPGLNWGAKGPALRQTCLFSARLAWLIHTVVDESLYFFPEIIKKILSFQRKKIWSFLQNNLASSGIGLYRFLFFFFFNAKALKVLWVNAAELGFIY